MAPLPKRRHSSRRQAKRTRALKKPNVTLVKCKSCLQLTLPHQVCQICGFYAGKMVITKKEKNKAKI